MEDFAKEFLLAFVPLFVAVDTVGILPMFVHMTGSFAPEKRRRIIVQSVFTALVVSILFLYVGRWLLRVLGITVADFMVAGGLLLLLLSVSDLLSAEKRQRHVDEESVGAVPLGVPLIAGPAVLTSILILADQHGYAPTLLSLVANIALVGAAFWFSEAIMGKIGTVGAKILSKLSSLLLAAIGVMIIRRGVIQLVQSAMERHS